MTQSRTRSFPPDDPLSKQIATLGAGAIGSALFVYAGLPGGALSGALCAVILLAATGHAARIGTPLRMLAMVVSGVSIGAAVTPESLRAIATYPVSLTLMVLGIAASMAATTWVLTRFFGWSTITALLAGTPGALSYVVASAIRLRADLPAIITVQMSRMFAVMVIMPLMISEVGPVQGAPHAMKSDSYLVAALILLAGFGVGYFVEKAKIIAGMLLASLAVSALAHATGLAAGRLPPALSIAGQVLIGTWVGARFVGFDWRNALTMGPGVLVSLAIAMGGAALLALFASSLLGLPYGVTLLAFAPGALEAVTLLAFTMGFDPLFVGTHHVVRFILLSLLMPPVIGYLTRRIKKNGGD